VSVDIARRSDFLPCSSSNDSFLLSLAEILAEIPCYGLMAKPSGEAATADTVVARAFVAVLITET
jgi:hypothetical protein